MMRRLCLLISVVLGLVVLGASLAWSGAGEGKKKEKEQERQVTLEQVPAPVKATILKHAGKSKIKEIEEVTLGKKKFYEAAWIKDGKEVEITVAPNGKLLGKEAEEEEEEEAEEEEEEEEEKEGKEEAEREVTARQVPAAALAALKELAAGAEITEFAEEIEHGHTFYEGSWKARSGAKMDVLVTPTGGLVEIEERVSADQVPAEVLKAAQKAAGKRAELGFEKKTMILYEVKFRKGERRHELLLTPDGRRVQEEVEKAKKGGKADDEDENDDDDNDDDNNDDDNG